MTISSKLGVNYTTKANEFKYTIATAIYFCITIRVNGVAGRVSQLGTAAQQ